MPSNPLPSSARSALREAAPHEAGRELDALIAEKVMGWPKIPGALLMFADDEGHARYFSDTITRREALSTFAHPYAFLPSTDIADAWEVVEKLRADGWGLSLHYEGEKSNQWVADYVRLDDNSEYTGEELGPTAPLAICRAALLASSPTGGTTE